MYAYYSRLIQKEYKMTHARNRLLNELILITEYISADALHFRCKDIGIATVYRTLDIFEKLQIVEVIKRDKCKLYKIRHPRKYFHIQFVCKTCEQVFQYDDPEMIQAFSIFKSYIETQFHHMLDDSLVLEGVCKSCLAKE
ncbi:hypothetical protein EZV73_17275 [Acidaminobacter sp. JC074]|uniref:Fur family transcriptional regulator n=1 Tax=Acidaminobacter sp. JC074 TaxID=2530199 RepID=UPI001F0DF874|nr:transcriptional repressor [Acidaminobacter sp. JC074]MCH4889353.1 hypothetical protein [Acidaminobacter sp. JC074]